MSPITLRDRIAGEVVVPGDATYDRLRKVFFHDGHPAAVVRPRTPDDIRHTLDHVRTHGLVLSVRSGGHSGAGFGTNDDGVVLDLSAMNRVELVDPSLHLVRVGTGATWMDVAKVLAPHGLAISSGDTASVGVGGLILGGGIGWLVRKYGLTIDGLVGAEVVTADGRLLRASAEEHADLFWAIRGGGGNFGVVTSFDLVAQPVRDVLFGTVSYPAAESATVLRRWRDAMREAPDDLTSTVQLMPAMPGASAVCGVSVCAPADESSVAAAAVEPLLGLGEVVAKDVAIRPYADVLEEPHELPPGLNPIAKNSFAPDLGDELIDRVTTGVAELGLVGQIRGLGGAVARMPNDATAFAHRDSEALVITALMGGPPEAQAAFGSFRDSLAPLASGSYGNLMSTVDPEDVESIYPLRTYERLRAVKRRYDPGNVFRRNYNVRPDSPFRGRSS